MCVTSHPFVAIHSKQKDRRMNPPLTPQNPLTVSSPSRWPPRDTAGIIGHHPSRQRPSSDVYPSHLPPSSSPSIPLSSSPATAGPMVVMYMPGHDDRRPYPRRGGGGVVSQEATLFPSHGYGTSSTTANHRLPDNRHLTAVEAHGMMPTPPPEYAVGHVPHRSQRYVPPPPPGHVYRPGPGGHELVAVTDPSSSTAVHLPQHPYGGGSNTTGGGYGGGHWVYVHPQENDTPSQAQYVERTTTTTTTFIGQGGPPHVVMVDERRDHGVPWWPASMVSPPSWLGASSSSSAPPFDHYHHHQERGSLPAQQYAPPYYAASASNPPPPLYLEVMAAASQARGEATLLSDVASAPPRVTFVGGHHMVAVVAPPFGSFAPQSHGGIGTIVLPGEIATTPQAMDAAAAGLGVLQYPPQPSSSAPGVSSAALEAAVVPVKKKKKKSKKCQDSNTTALDGAIDSGNNLPTADVGVAAAGGPALASRETATGADAAADDDIASRNVYVESLPEDCRSADLRELFAKFGNVLSCKVYPPRSYMKSHLKPHRNDSADASGTPQPLDSTHPGPGGSDDLSRSTMGSSDSPVIGPVLGQYPSHLPHRSAAIVVDPNRSGSGGAPLGASTTTTNDGTPLTQDLQDGASCLDAATVATPLELLSAHRSAHIPTTDGSTNNPRDGKQEEQDDDAAPPLRLPPQLDSGVHSDNHRYRRTDNESPTDAPQPPPTTDEFSVSILSIQVADAAIVASTSSSSVTGAFFTNATATSGVNDAPPHKRRPLAVQPPSQLPPSSSSLSVTSSASLPSLLVPTTNPRDISSIVVFPTPPNSAATIDSRHFGFVLFALEADAQAAVLGLNGYILGNCPIAVRIARRTPVLLTAAAVASASSGSTRNMGVTRTTIEPRDATDVAPAEGGVALCDFH